MSREESRAYQSERTASRTSFALPVIMLNEK
jgi:hypothetical protein